MGRMAAENTRRDTGVNRFCQHPFWCAGNEKRPPQDGVKGRRGDAGALFSYTSRGYRISL